MPNWCMNEITISIDPESGKEGFDLFKSTLNTANGNGEIVPFSFHQTVPRPPSEDNDWYVWNNANWGTKWDVYDPADVRIEGNDTILISVDTAWSPPDKWAIAVATKFKVCVVIDYDEIGMDLYGTFTATPRVYYDEDREREDEDYDTDVEDDDHLVDAAV